MNTNSETLLLKDEVFQVVGVESKSRSTSKI